MQTEFRAIVHGEYGAAEDVLRLAECQFKSEELGPDDVLVQVTARPVHPGDIQILSALPQGGPVVRIPKGTLRVPQFEGVGTIVRLGTNPEVANRFREALWGPSVFVGIEGEQMIGAATVRGTIHLLHSLWLAGETIRL
jgi:NADPH:quinone reductase-like Zn-dependent oxidoreductase